MRTDTSRTFLPHPSEIRPEGSGLRRIAAVASGCTAVVIAALIATHIASDLASARASGRTGQRPAPLPAVLQAPGDALHPYSDAGTIGLY